MYDGCVDSNTTMKIVAPVMAKLSLCTSMGTVNGQIAKAHFLLT